MTTNIDQVFAEQKALAAQLQGIATSDVQTAFNALSNANLYTYTPYNWQIPSPPILLGINLPLGPSKPGRPTDPKEPTLVTYGMNIPNPDFGSVPVNPFGPPTITFPSQPSGEPQDTTGSPPAVGTPSFPAKPDLFPLPSSALPYPTLTIPGAPVFVDPVFDGVKPDDINNITLDEYLQKLTDSYATYSQSIPGLVQSNALAWLRTIVDENPNIRLIDNIITVYLTAGGSGVPTPIEEAIVTRATDRVTVEQRRKTAAVWESMAMKGLTLPSGALMSGLKEARAEGAEAVSKVATDVAIKNLDLEHDHMKFMLTLGRELNQMLVTLANDSAKVMAELNGQAIEMAKTVLTGMIEVNNTIVKIYLAKWEGYKAAVEVFKAKWMAIEMQIRVYEAEIKAELAKVEINKGVVEVLTAMIHANEVLVQMYKTQIDAETAKIETDRVRILGYEAAVRGYVAKVEAYKARWDGYKAAVDGQLAVAKVYEAEQAGFKATVEAYTAGVEAYRAQVMGYSAQVEAISKQNEAALKAWSIEFDGVLKAYASDIDAYGKNWSAIGEQMRGQATVLGIQGEFLSKMYGTQLSIDMEKAREHFSQWTSRLQQGLAVGKGLSEAANVAAGMANSALNSLSAFAGTFTTNTTSG